MINKTAEELVGKERLEWLRAQNDRQDAMKATKRRSRLTLEDFEDIGVSIPQQLWEGLQRIEDPVVYMKMFFEMLSFLAPKLSTIDIQQEITTNGAAGPVDFSGVSAATLVTALREERRSE